MGELYVSIDYFGFRSQSWQGAKINAAVKHTRQDGACLARAMSAGPRALPTTESAYATNPLSVFMHTNRAVRPGAKRLGFELRTGWWAETHDVAALRRRLPKRNFPYHWQVTLHQSFKVSWLLGAAKGAPEPWVLADTDTIFQQCDAAEYSPPWREKEFAVSCEENGAAHGLTYTMADNLPRTTTHADVRRPTRDTRPSERDMQAQERAEATTQRRSRSR